MTCGGMLVKTWSNAGHELEFEMVKRLQKPNHLAHCGFRFGPLFWSSV
jgi:hypothetical protein